MEGGRNWCLYWQKRAPWIFRKRAHMAGGDLSELDMDWWSCRFTDGLHPLGFLHIKSGETESLRGDGLLPSDPVFSERVGLESALADSK